MFKKLNVDCYINTDNVLKLVISKLPDDKYRLTVKYTTGYEETICESDYEICHKKLIDLTGLQSTLQL